MKKIYTLIPLIFTAFVSTSALAATGTCSLKLVDEDGNFSSSDYGPGGMVTYDVVMPFTDGYYPNWTTSQPKPEIPFSNCITHQGAPANAVITAVTYNYTFQQAVLVANYQILVGFLGTPNVFSVESLTGGGIANGSGIPLNGSGAKTGANGRLLSAVSMQLRSQVTNPAVNADCPSYYQRDECKTKNARLTVFTANVAWSG